MVERTAERGAKAGEGPSARALAALVTGTAPERARALDELTEGAGASVPLVLEGALVDLLHEAPELLPGLARKLAARPEEPAARRALDLLARFTSPAAPAELAEEVRATALRALRGEDEGGAFAAKLDAFLAKLPRSPLVEKLSAQRATTPDLAARAFAQAWELARATSDPALATAARDELAPALVSLGVQPLLDPVAEAAAFDVRPATGSPRPDEVARPAVRAKGGALLVRGVVLRVQAAPHEESPSEVALLLRRALAQPASAEAREAALLGLVDALARRLEGEPAPAEAGALADELARGALWSDLAQKARVARALAALARRP